MPETQTATFHLQGPSTSTPTLPWFSHIHPPTRSLLIIRCIAPASSIKRPCAIELANVQASNCVNNVAVNTLGWCKCLPMNYQREESSILPGLHLYLGSTQHAGIPCTNKKQRLCRCGYPVQQRTASAHIHESDIQPQCTGLCFIRQVRRVAWETNGLGCRPEGALCPGDDGQSQ